MRFAATIGVVSGLVTDRSSLIGAMCTQVGERVVAAGFEMLCDFESL